MAKKARGTLFIVSAPSGAGKTSLINALLEQADYLKLSISHTTREIRPGEADGQHYHYVSESEFNDLLGQDMFLEHATVHGNFYGTSKEWVNRTLDEGLDVMLEIDWQGGLQVQELMPEAISVFILPPSVEALRQRLEGRNQDSAETIQDRINGAVAEMEHYHQYQYLLVNDDFGQTLSELKAICVAERLRIQTQRIKYSSLINELLEE